MFQYHQSMFHITLNKHTNKTLLTMWHINKHTNKTLLTMWHINKHTNKTLLAMWIINKHTNKTLLAMWHIFSCLSFYYRNKQFVPLSIRH